MLIKMRDEITTKGLVNLVNVLPVNGIRMVEVGSYAGESAEIFANSGKIVEIWCIDPWTPGYDQNDSASSSDFAEVEAAFDKVAERHKDKIHKFKGTLKDFQSKFQDYVPDFVYIDANHTYDGCKSDIETALRWNGRGLKFLGGHDYSSCWPGVMKAVDEVFEKPTAVSVDSSWVKVL